MGKLLEAMLRVQLVERDLTHVRGRLKVRQHAVALQEKRIQQLRADWQALHDRAVQRRKDADSLELDLKEREAKVTKLRTALNTCRTNKDYAAILTQINSAKADNARLEEDALRVLQDIDAVKADAEKVRLQVEAEQKRLQDTQQSQEGEVQRLSRMLEELTAKRAEAAAAVPSDAMAVFDRIAENYDGDAMAVIEVHGKKPPHDYVCGGCFMGLSAEHANALRTRDEIRTCDNCGRILYLEPQSQTQPSD